MSEQQSYEERTKSFSWSIAEKELGYSPGDIINIGWHCSDRICRKGLGSKIALYYEGFGGTEKSYTFNDIRLAGNTIGDFLRKQGITEGDRVCLFMDRIPELYLSFLGILKIGAVVQPLFSAFGDESLFVRLDNAGTRAVITQKKHLSKVRKIRHSLPNLEFVIIVDNAKPGELEPGEILFNLGRAEAVEEFEIAPTRAETHSLLHYTSGTTGQPKGVKHVHYSIMSQYLTTKWVLDLHDNDIYWCTADPGWVTGTS